MKILVITTGGTIGSAFDGTSIDVRSDAACPVCDRYIAEHNDVQFDIRNPLNILSEQITCDDFNTLARALYQADLQAYGGVVLTVGSDNLAYICSFIGLLFGSCGVPICLVASDKVLSDPNANGYDNFCCAVELIRRGIQGAYVPYRNSDGRMLIHSATDIRQADLSDDFYSFHGAVDGGDFDQLHELKMQTIPDIFSAEHPPVITENVLLIHPYPMQDYSVFGTNGKKAILHILYHSGTLENTVAARLMKESGDMPFYLASLRSGRPIYASTDDMIRLGAIPLYDISPECAYMKLLLACAQDEMSIRDFMEDGI